MAGLALVNSPRGKKAHDLKISDLGKRSPKLTHTAGKMKISVVRRSPIIKQPPPCIAGIIKSPMYHIAGGKRCLKDSSKRATPKRGCGRSLFGAQVSLFWAHFSCSISIFGKACFGKVSWHYGSLVLEVDGSCIRSSSHNVAFDGVWSFSSLE